MRKRTHQKKGTTRVISCKKSAKGGESWRLATDGEVRTVKSSGRSTKSMDRAVKKYSKALESLAKR